MLQNRELKLWSHGENCNFALDFIAPGPYAKLLLICFHIFPSVCLLFVLVYLADLLFFPGNVARNMTELHHYCFSELYQLSEL